MSRRRKILLVLSAAFAALAAAWLLCPRPSLYGETTFSTLVTDRDGRLLRLALAADDRYRLKLALADISPAAIDAVLLYEDRHFWRHPGVNPASLLRAAWTTWVSRERAMGASTITMQLARLRFDLDTRSIAGKLGQIARAVQLERHYSKHEILEAYLNLAPYGGNIEGIGTAALIYFDKAAAELTLPEALALAVIPQNPVHRDPTRAAGRAELAAARARLLAAWNEDRPVGSEVEAQVALPLAVRAASELPFRAPHVASLASSAAHGRVKTTLDLARQDLVERQLVRYVERQRSRGIRNASAMLLDHRSMEVLASVGSADFFATAIAGQVDGTRARRSPGSTLKPFVYGLAIDQGLIHPASLMTDAPRRFAAYTPENFDRGFMGPISAREALIYSRNVPAIELLSRVGHDRFHAFLLDSGVGQLAAADHYGLAMILGGNELTMQEIVAQYAMLANGGVMRPLQLLPGTGEPAPARRLLSAEASYLVLDMLRDNPRPNATGIGASHALPIAWKTGTSYAFRDAWTVGVFGPYVLAVWVGNFDGSPNPAFVGRTAAAPLFFDIADALSGDVDANHYRREPPPELNLVEVDVCAGTGGLPGRHCPRTEKTWFVPGVSPIGVANVHRALRIDNATGLQSCHGDDATSHEAVFEFWPSDILSVYRRAGIDIRQPPAWAPGCRLDEQATRGVPPEIRSPSPGVSYRVRLDRLADERIALQATADSDVRRLYWFVNDRFVAAAGRDETLFWPAVPGRHRVLAVDDMGRSHARELLIRTAL